MAGDVGTLLLAAVGIALSPLPLLLALGLVGSPEHGSRERIGAFVAAQALTIAGVFAVAVFVFRAENGADGLNGSLGGVEVGIGAVLFALLAVHLRRERTDPGTELDFLDRIGPRGAFAAGLGMVVLNPKNLALTLVGAAAVTDLGGTVGVQITRLLLFTAAASSLLALLLVAVAAFPRRTSALLARGRALVISHERRLGAVLLLGLGSFFVLRGLADLTT